MTASGDNTRSSLDSAVRVGAVLIAVGTLATIATLVPLFSSLEALPVGVYLLCFLAPLGLAVILMALWRRARSRSARLRAASDSNQQ